MNAEQLRKLRNRLIGVSPEAPKAYYVSQEGNDNRDGKSLVNAFRTITKGIEVLNNTVNKKGVILYIAPGGYIEPAGIKLENDYCIIKCIDPISGKIYFVGSDDFYEPGETIGIATDNLLIVKGRHNIILGLTIFCNSTDYAGMKFEDQSGGGSYGGQNLIEKCFFSPFTEDATKYCVDVFGGTRNHFKKCQFNGPTTAGIWLRKGYGAPVETIVEDCDFIGTNRGIIIDGENYNTLIRRCWFTKGSRTGEEMDNAIEITTGMNLGKVTVVNCNFEQLAANDILDNKTGGNLVEIDNKNGVTS